MSKFRCALCEGEFDKAWSDEEAAAEAAIIFPGHNPAHCDVVCDDCFQLMGFAAPSTTTSHD